MHTRTCNSAIWILVGLAILLLMFHGSISLLAVLVPASLILAGAAMWAGNRHANLTRDHEKR
jgi:membrane protein DedA with SNARE-associated domain